MTDADVARDFYRGEGYAPDTIEELVQQDLSILNGQRTRKTTVTFVNLSDIYDHLELSNAEVEWIADSGFDCVSYGDAFATLIRPRYALDCMVEAYESFHRNHLVNKTMTHADFCQKFWEIVDSDDYVNLED